MGLVNAGTTFPTTEVREMRGYLDVLYDYLNGSHAARLSADQAFAVYVEADGFGDCRSGEARTWLRDYFDGGRDWSHVRDSSDAAIERAALKLQAVVNGRAA
jgi:hypothetical protein